MFVTTGVGCTCSPRKKTITLSPKGTRPHGATAVAAQPVANGIPRPDRPGLPFRSNPSKMNTYAKYAAKPRTMCTSKIVGLKASCNEHLRKNGGRGGLIVTQPVVPREAARSLTGYAAGQRRLGANRRAAGADGTEADQRFIQNSDQVRNPERLPQRAHSGRQIVGGFLRKFPGHEYEKRLLVGE